eukprot:Ihof_evm3s444 gene=Ihof_evmTU3s444
METVPRTGDMRVVYLNDDLDLVIMSDKAEEGYLSAWHVRHIAAEHKITRPKEKPSTGSELNQLGLDSLSNTIRRLATEKDRAEHTPTVEMTCVWYTHVLKDSLEACSFSNDRSEQIGRWDWLKAGSGLPTTTEDIQAWATKQYFQAQKDRCVIDVGQSDAAHYVKESLDIGRCFVMYNCLGWENHLFPVPSAAGNYVAPNIDLRKNSEGNVSQLAVQLPGNSNHQHIYVVAYFDTGVNSQETQFQANRRRRSSTSMSNIMHEANISASDTSRHNSSMIGGHRTSGISSVDLKGYNSPSRFKIGVCRLDHNQHALWVLDRTHLYVHGVIFTCNPTTGVPMYQPHRAFVHSAVDFTLLDYPPYDLRKDSFYTGLNKEYKDQDTNAQKSEEEGGQGGEGVVWHWIGHQAGDGLLVEPSGALKLLTGWGEVLVELVCTESSLMPTGTKTRSNNINQEPEKTLSRSLYSSQKNQDNFNSLNNTIGSGMSISMSMDDSFESVQEKCESNGIFIINDQRPLAILGLGDAVGSRVTLDIENRPKFRARMNFLPKCGLARDLLQALSLSLPRYHYLSVRSAVLTSLSDLPGHIGCHTAYQEVVAILESVSRLIVNPSNQPPSPTAVKVGRDPYEELLASSYHKEYVSGIRSTKVVANPSHTTSIHAMLSSSEIARVLLALHAVYEGAKLCTLYHIFLPVVVDFLTGVAYGLGWHKHLDYYIRDGGLAPNHTSHEVVTPTITEPSQCMSYFDTMYQLVSSPALPSKQPMTTMVTGDHSTECNPRVCQFAQYVINAFAIMAPSTDACRHKALAYLAANGFEPSTLDCLPGAAARFYFLIGREDLLAMETASDTHAISREQALRPTNKTKEDPDGMRLTGKIYQMRFSADRRLDEARRILISHKPMTVRLDPKKAVRDHDILEEQQLQLLGLVTRNMALGPGRGMLYLNSARPIVSEAVVIPPICYSGRLPNKKATVELEHH